MSQAVLLSLPDGDDNASAEARLTSDPVHLEPVVEAQSGGQRLVLASAECPALAGVDVLVDVMHDYGWRLLAGGKPHLEAVQLTRLLDCLPGGPDGQPILAPAASWDQVLQTLLNSATARAPVSVLHRYHKAFNDIWPDLWFERCEGGCIPPSRYFHYFAAGVAPRRRCGCIRLCPAV